MRFFAPKFRVHIVATTVLITCIIFLGAGLLLATLTQFERIAEESSQQVYEQMVYSSAQKIGGITTHARRAVEQATELVALYPWDRENPRPDLLETLFRTVVAMDENIYGLYLGWPQAEFFQIIGVRNRENIQAALKAPKETVWAIRTIVHDFAARGEHWFFLDQKGQLLETRHQRAVYDPTGRPWFEAATKNQGEMITTAPYVFSSTGKPGLTFAKKALGQTAIVGLDISLDQLQAHVTQISRDIPGGLLVMDDQGRILAWGGSKELAAHGEITALSTLAETAHPYFADLNRLLGQNTQTGHTALLNNELHVIVRHPIEIAQGIQYSVVGFAPLSAFDAHILRTRNQIALFAGLFLLLAVPMAYVLSRQSARKLIALAHDSERIKVLDFDGNVDAKSVFYEIDVLGQAHKTMKTSIRERTHALATAQNKLQTLVESGLALASEKDPEKVLEDIMINGQKIASADAVTLYRVTPHKTLAFARRSKDDELPVNEIPLYDKAEGRPNLHFVSVRCALQKETICIDDTYSENKYDFTGTHAFDRDTGYRTVSMLTVPMVTLGGQTLGVIQFLNAIDPETGKIVPFDPAIIQFVEALAAQGAMALNNQQLLESQEKLLDSLIQIMASAIDAKSPYTGGHCERVPELATLLAQEASAVSEGPLSHFRFDTDDQWREFRIGAWLHDCGKMTTPEYVVDKATKLETIFNRIHEVRTRFEVLLRDAYIRQLRAILKAEQDPGEAKALFEKEKAALMDDFAFIARCNVGNEFMADEDITRLQQIGARTWTRYFDDRLGLSHEELRRHDEEPASSLPAQENLLSNKSWHRLPRNEKQKYDPKYGFKTKTPALLYDFGELYNLSVRRGTLTEEERFKINEHVIQTIVMLDHLPLPASLSRIPEYAGTHHETLAGTGYPRGLDETSLSIPARIMAIADVFEALTACDRPYKAPKTLSESIRILSFFVKDRHIDANLFILFLESGVYQRYAQRYLRPDQLDEVDIAPYIKMAREFT